MKDPRAAAPAYPFFGEPRRVGEIFCFRKFFWREFVLVLVVIARITPTDKRLLMRAVENFFVRRGEFKIYHRNFLAFSSSWFVRLNSDRAFQHRNRARVAIPHLDRVIAEKAVAT